MKPFQLLLDPGGSHQASPSFEQDATLPNPFSADFPASLKLWLSLQIV